MVQRKKKYGGGRRKNHLLISMKTTSKMQSLKKLIRRNNIGEEADIFSVKQITSSLYILCRVLAICVFLFVLFVHESVYSQELDQQQKNTVALRKSDIDSIRTKSPVGAAFRSIIAPGWGQFYNGKKTKGFLAIAGEGILGYAIYNQNKKFRDTDLEDSVRNDYRERRDTLQWWLFFAVGLSAVDAYVDAYLYKFNKKMDVSYAEFQNGIKGFSIRIKL
jgi:hypothetical protein